MLSKRIDRRPMGEPRFPSLPGLSLTLGLALVLTLPLSAIAEPESLIPRSDRPEAAQVYLIAPEDGHVLKSPVLVRFGLSGMGVAPAGVEKAATGHHHLIIDADLPPPNLPIPKNEHYRHFGGGQTETLIELAPGKHTLQLMLGDHIHMPHSAPVVSEKVTITVEK